jgi:Tfp pilus assembly protein PilZ
MPCSLRIDGREHRALVLNLSTGGLFVRTTARARPGARIELELPVEGKRESLPLCASVVWRRLTPSTVSQLNEGGLGLRISDAPPAYLDLMAELSGDPSVAETQLLCFDVRVKQSAGPRSRWLRVDGSDEAAACALALSKAGADWEILEVRRAS